MFNIMKILTTLIVIIALSALTLAKTPVRKCDNLKQLPLSVQVETCSEMPCDLWKGYDTNMAIQFVANRNGLSQIKSEVEITTLGVKVPFDLEEERCDVCRNLMFGAYCPMDKQEDATYHLVLNIAEYQPEVPIKIEVNLRDTVDDTIIACFIVDAKIKKGSSTLH